MYWWLLITVVAFILTLRSGRRRNQPVHTLWIVLNLTCFTLSVLALWYGITKVAHAPLSSATSWTVLGILVFGFGSAYISGRNLTIQRRYQQRRRKYARLDRAMGSIERLHGH